MKTKYTRKNRIVSIVLCVTLVLGLVLPTGVQAASVSKVYTAAELDTSGVPLVPAALTSNSSFMGDYVQKGGKMSLNGNFSRYGSKNADGAGSTLPNGTIDGDKSADWYASYKWAASQAQRDVINRADVKLYFSSSMIPDYHTHYSIFSKTSHWSTSAIRLTRGNDSGGNTWTHGASDYGHQKNGDLIESWGSKQENSGTPQPVSAVWADYPAGDKALFYNAYFAPGNMCGNPKTSGALFYAVDESSPTITGVEFAHGTYTSLLNGNVTETVTIRFSEKIRFADNAAHDGITLKLDAEYLEQADNKNSGFTITAGLAEMGYDYMKFEFTVPKDYLHIKVTGLSADQPDLMANSNLVIFDGNGNSVVTYTDAATSMITDLAGNSLVFSRKTFSQYYDGVAPELDKIEMSGPDISAVSGEYNSWTDNAGTRRYIYAGAGDRITFQAVFNESINIKDTSTAKAVLSIKDENGSNITLPYKSHSGTTVTFQDLNVTEAMKNAGDRIYILRFEGMEVTDYAGNAVSTSLTSGLMVPAQNITLDVDKPQVSSTIPDDYIESSDPLVYRPYADAAGGEYFSFPVTFQDFNNGGADRSGVADTQMQFSLDMAEGGSYYYKWAIDHNQTVTDDTQWANGTTGAANTVPSLAEGTQYWVHIYLDPNVDYNYTANLGEETSGVYFNGSLNFSHVSDWAGNLADTNIRYTLRHSVDNKNPTYWFDVIKLTPDYDNGKVTFSTRIKGMDSYGIKQISYRWQIKPWGSPESEYQYMDGVGEWTVVTPDELGLNKEFWVEPSYTYDYTAEGAFRSGQVRLEVMVEDMAGNLAGSAPHILKTRLGSFDYQLASSRSTVTTNKQSAPVVIPEVSMREPYQPYGSNPENTPRSLLIIPIPKSVNEEGKYTEFYIWDPWDWDTNGVENGTGVMQYVANPLTAIEDYLADTSLTTTDLAEIIKGSYYYARGTVDPETNSADFTYLSAYFHREELEELQEFFDNYYGRMDLYIATTSSPEEFAYTGWVKDADGVTSYECPDRNALDLSSAQTTMQTYSVYMANNPEYKVVTESITNAQGLTDEENTEYKLTYNYDSRPARNLDNVAVTVQITNERDQSAALGEGFGLELLDYSYGNAAFKLYYTGSNRNYSSKPTSTPVKTWNLVKTSDGRQTIVFEPGLCTQNGWYALWLETEDTNSGLAIEQNLGQFFMDSTVLDITATSAQKVYSISDTRSFWWNANKLEQILTNEGEFRLGLAPAPEGWTQESATITFTNTTRPSGDQADPKEMAQLRVYNQTYNVQKGLSLEEGVWQTVTPSSAWGFSYGLYLADLTEEAPYAVTDAEGNTACMMPMVEGRNLIVYEIQSTNGVITTHEMVIDVSTKAEEWELVHEVTCAEGTENAISAEAWPVGPQGEALDLNESGNFDRNKYNFRETDSWGDYVSSYTYDRDVEGVEYFLVDLYGNISTKSLTITDDYGNVRVIDARPPEWIDFTYDANYPDYAEMHDSGNSGDTFYFEVYAWDNESEIDPRDVTITFDAEYSAVLPQVGGTMGEDGRFTMPIPLALDENGELLKNEDGTYAVWESIDTNHNGIFRTQVMETESDSDNPGWVSIAVVGTFKYDETLTDTTRTLTVTVSDAHKNAKSADLEWDTNNDPYCLDLYAGDQDYGFGMLNENGVLGLYSDVPFVSIEGYGTGELVQHIDSWAGFRVYLTEAPMITQDSPIVGEDEDGYPIYEPYQFTVTDLFGETYTLGFEMTMYGELGIDVEFSTTEPTNQAVTVYAEATGNIEKITSIVAENGTEGTIDPEDPSKASIVMEENGTVTIVTDAGNERTVQVSNIDKTLGEAYIVYYNESYSPLNPEVGATEVTVVLSCDTEYLYATNGPDSYTFPAGSKAGDTYTFEYRDQAGNTGTITAVLPVDLEIPEGPDTEAPDVNVGIYAGLRSGYELLERYDNPEYDETAGESELTARINDPANGGIRASAMRLILNIQDVSPVKVLVVPTGSEAPADYASATQGSTVDGVTLSVSRNTATVDIAENVTFDLYIIDEQGNVNANRMIRIIAIDHQAPELVPSYTVSTDPETGYSTVTATFYPTGEDLFAEITALSADAESRQEVVTDTDGKTVTVTRYYYVFESNGTYSFRYEDDLGNIGVAQAEVLGLTTDPARVISAAWYGTKQGIFSNVLPEESDPVNRDVTAQLRMSKAISAVELFIYDAQQPDGIGAPLPEDAPVKASCKNSVIDVTYTGNVDYEIVVRFTASGNGRKDTYVLSKVECIDKELPQVSLKSAELSEDKRSIVFTFDSSEDVIFSMDPGKGMAATHQWTATDDKPMTLYFTDKAGNQRSYLVDDFAGLDTDYLKASFSASADGVDPTGDPAIDLDLKAGDTLYVHVSKAAAANLNGTDLGQFTADAWNPIVLPDESGVHILRLTDANTGDMLLQAVFAKAIDRIAPVITFESSTVLVNRGVSAEEMMEAIYEGVNVSDNLDAEVACAVSGYPADTQEGGLYTLTYTAEDSAGNRVTASRYLYILDEDMPILWINGEVGLPYSTVYLEGGDISLTMENMDALAEQPLVIKYGEGMLTTGQMKYYGVLVEDMHFQVGETGYYTIHVRAQDRTEFVTYIYVEG